MWVDFFLQLVFGAYFSFILFVLPIIDGILWVQRFSKKWNKVFFGVMYSILSAGLKCVVFYFLLFIVFPFKDLASGESSLIRELIFQVLVLVICSFVTCLSYSWGKKQKFKASISDLIRSLTRRRNIFISLAGYLVCAILFSLGFSLFLRMIVKATEEFVSVDVRYFLELLVLVVVSISLFVAGSALFLKIRTRGRNSEIVMTNNNQDDEQS